MTQFRTAFGTPLDTADATDSWPLQYDAALALGQHFTHADTPPTMTLYRTSRGDFYVVTWRPTPGRASTAAVINRQQAIRLLQANNHPLPPDLLAIGT